MCIILSNKKHSFYTIRAIFYIKREIYPLAVFYQDLIQVLSKILQEECEIILLIDDNKNMSKGKL